MNESEESLNESLSAAIDGEADELELRRVLNATRDDAEMRAKWQRMHLIGSAIRRDARLPVTSSPPEWPSDMDATVADDEPRRSRARWLAPLGGAAIAAAAALAVVLAFGPDEPTATEGAIADRQGAPQRGLANVPSELDVQRANAYMQQHARHTSIAARTAAMPFVKVLSTPADDRDERDIERDREAAK